MDELKSLDQDFVKVELGIDIPGSLVGDDVGMLFRSQQYLAPEELSSSFDTEYVLLRTLQKMSKELTDKLVEKLNAKRDRSR